MNFNTLCITPLSVDTIIEDEAIHDEVVAVHGQLYSGADCLHSEILFLPRDGSFDGRLTRPAIEDRKKILLVDDPQLAARLAREVPHLTGHALYNLDAILIGRVIREAKFEYNICLRSLSLIIMQNCWPLPREKQYSNIYVMQFSAADLPKPMWESPILHRDASDPVLKVL